MNSVNLVGRLTKEPELRYSPSGMACCSFTVAVDRAYQKQGEEKKTDFIPCFCFGKTAENTANFLAKGKLAGVSGSIQISSWESDGKRHYKTEVYAERVEFLSPKSNSNSYGHEVSDDSDLPF